MLGRDDFGKPIERRLVEVMLLDQPQVLFADPLKMRVAQIETAEHDAQRCSDQRDRDKSFRQQIRWPSFRK
jgi:hypothetical protein